MLATTTPQMSVNETIGKPSECDIAVFILWSRMGTPLPDSYRKPDGTGYRSGTEWEYENAIRGKRRGSLPEVVLYHRTERVPIDFGSQDFEEQLEQARSVKAFLDAFKDASGAGLGGLNKYATPTEFEDKLEAHLRELIERRIESLPAREAPQAPEWQGSPFPGLRAFSEVDEPIYFGRGPEIDALIARLRGPEARLIVVVGASGSGKSSLIAAGLVPRLKRKAVDESEKWLYPEPFTPGYRLPVSSDTVRTNPFYGLAVRLYPYLRQREPGDVAGDLQANPAHLADIVAEILHGRPADTRVLLFIDQFEELFTEVREQAVRDKFLDMLVRGGQTEGLRTILTIRADFYHHCVEHSGFADLLRRQGNATFPLAVPDRTALHAMIGGPAAAACLGFEGDLAERIVNDVCGRSGVPEPGALALMAFALEQLYEAREAERGMLTIAAYEALAGGKGESGVHGAIGTKAESMFRELSENAQQALPDVFRALVNVNERGVATRRRAPQRELTASPSACELLTAFSSPKARLFVTDAPPNDEPIVQVAHEALFQSWPRLKTWIGERTDALRLLRQVEGAACQWEADGRPQSHLWPHERLTAVYEAFGQLDLEREKLEEPLRGFTHPEAERLLDELKDTAIDHYRRAEIGDRLDRIGDTRRGVGLREDGIPDIDWVPVLGGRVCLEDSKGIFEVKPFDMARYPLTWVQYRAFVEEPEGYRKPAWWQGLDREEKEPGTQYRHFANCPADNVSWYDVVAFCRWLTQRLQERGLLPDGRVVHLPTEWEWQQAATGGNPANTYPWGASWDPNRVNTWECRLGRTTAVGMYPHGSSPVGTLDMSGNVWEWCLNEYEEPGQIRLTGKADRAVRGGSWGRGQHLARAACRYGRAPGFRRGSLGVRLACPSPSKEMLFTVCRVSGN
jgi:hypothetical protein